MAKKRYFYIQPAIPLHLCKFVRPRNRLATAECVDKICNEIMKPPQAENQMCLLTREKIRRSALGKFRRYLMFLNLNICLTFGLRAPRKVNVVR
jgi:hypothetical protein